MKRFWIEVRWPMIPEDRLDLLYFHKGQYHRAQQMREGDEALYYETLVRDQRKRGDCTDCTWRTTCPKLRGSQTIFAHVIVQGDLEWRRPPLKCGGYTWDRIRHVELVLPEKQDLKHPGVPLLRVRELIGNRPMYGMEIREEQQFRRLAAQLKETVECARAAHPSRPRQWWGRSP